MNKINRRNFIKTGLAGTAGFLSSPVFAFNPTPRETQGPFYPVRKQKDKDFDLTRIAGKPGLAKGRVIVIQGRVVDMKGHPIENARVDLWQANAAGRYRHLHDSNLAPLDPNFQGWAIVSSGKDGKFLFKTIYPGAYPAAKNWVRPPHIHFKISKKEYLELVTQMYFPAHILNDSDLLLQQKTKAEQKLMIAAKVQDNPETFEYNIVLQKNYSQASS